MAINLVVAITDRDWFEELSQLPNLMEVNHWSTSSKQFHSLQQGEMFLFKLRKPSHKIVVGGIFSHAMVLPTYYAWQSFDLANGAGSLESFEDRISKHTAGKQKTNEIGCRIVMEPFFFDEQEWIDPPSDWHMNIQKYKGYPAEQGEGLRVYLDVLDRLRRRPENWIVGQADRYGKPQIILPRLGQGGFRTLVSKVYNRRCAVTGERTFPALEAAHIIPYRDNGPHKVSNGLLLRRDIHSLFDAGYVTVTPKMDFEVSRRIRDEFENGREYYDLHGTRIRVPRKPEFRPNLQSLSWHNENVYKG